MGEKSTFGAPINNQMNVSVAFSVPSSVQIKNWWKTALIYSFTAASRERGGAKGYANWKLEQRDACKV